MLFVDRELCRLERRQLADRGMYRMRLLARCERYGTSERPETLQFTIEDFPMQVGNSL